MIVPVKQAARELGMSRSTLYRLAEESEFYAPSAEGCGEREAGSSLRGYHQHHLELIEAVRCGIMAEAEARLRWERWCYRKQRELRPGGDDVD